MWTLVIFDLPTTTGPMRRAFARFRKQLLALGFEMLQKSVYLRWEDSEDAARTLIFHVQAMLPANGKVTILPLSRRTWLNSRNFLDGLPRPPRETPPDFYVCA